MKSIGVISAAAAILGIGHLDHSHPVRPKAKASSRASTPTYTWRHRWNLPKSRAPYNKTRENARRLRQMQRPKNDG